MDESISWTMEKIELSSVNSFAVNDRLWVRSFILERRVVLKWTLGIHQLVLVTNNMPDHLKGHVDICHLKNLSTSFKGVPKILIDWTL